MNQIRISFIQTELFWEDSVQNINLFNDKIFGIKEESDIIILPEMFNSAFTMNAEKCAEDEAGMTLEWMKKKAEEKNAVITGSIIIRENNNFYNRLFWVKPDGSYQKYDKRHLFRLGNENLHYTQGKEILISEHKGWKFRPLICYDLRFPVWSKNKLNVSHLGDVKHFNYDYDCLIYVANWPLPRINAWRSLLISRAIENMSYVIGVNRIGTDGNGISHPGCSMVVDYKGNIIYECRHDTEDTPTIALSLKELSDYRQHFAFALDWDNFTIDN